jgi:hypothetical protein
MPDSAQTQRFWISNLAKLTAVAINLFRRKQLFDGLDSEPVMKGLGKSPMDFAADAMTEFYENRSKYHVRSDDEGFAVMVTILEHDFLDACRSHAFERTDDPLHEDREAPATARSSNPLSATEADDLAQKLYPYTHGEAELKDVIDAAAYLAVEQNEQLTRDDVVKLIDITPDEFTKRKNRLAYRFNASDGRSSDD